MAYRTALLVFLLASLSEAFGCNPVLHDTHTYDFASGAGALKRTVQLDDTPHISFILVQLYDMQRQLPLMDFNELVGNYTVVEGVRSQ